MKISFKGKWWLVEGSSGFLYSFIPLTVMFTANCLIILKFMLAKLKDRQGGSESVNQALSKSAVKGSVMLLTISFAFIILTAPICITYTITVDPPVIVYGITVILVYLNHSINGVLYSISGSRFRHELIQLFVCCGTRGTATISRGTTSQSLSTPTSILRTFEHLTDSPCLLSDPGLITNSC